MFSTVGMLFSIAALYITLFFILRGAHRNNKLKLPEVIDGWVHTLAMTISREKQPNFYIGVLTIYAACFIVMTAVLLFAAYQLVAGG